MRDYKAFQKYLLGIKPGLLIASILLNIGIFCYSAINASCVRGILNYIGEADINASIGITVWICLSCMILAAIMRTFCIKASSYVDSLRGYYYKESLRINMMKKFLHAKNMKEVSANPGKILEQLDDDVPVTTFPVELLTEVSGYIIYTLVAIGSLLIINWKITIFVFIPLSIGIYIIKCFTVKIQKSRNANRSMHDVTTVALSDMVSSTMMIKALGEQESILKFYDSTNEKRRKVVLKDSLFQHLVNKSVDISSMVGIAAIMLAVVSLMRKGEFPIGDFAIFVIYLGTLNDCICRILELVTENKKAEVSFKRMVTYVSVTDLIQKITLSTNKKAVVQYEESDESKFKLEPLQSLQVKDLTCLYEDGRGVKDVNFDLHSSEILAVSGKVASGKSSMVYAITGAKPYETGEICWNGYQVAKEDQLSYPYVGVALQNGNLLNNTIRYNVTLGKKCSDDAIFKALHSCCMADEVKRMPKGLDTIVGESGLLLSGGQRQRILFARMLIFHPMLYIIDNATNALDVKTEKLLYQNFRRIIDDEKAAAIVINDREVLTELADSFLTV